MNLSVHEKNEYLSMIMEHARRAGRNDSQATDIATRTLDAIIQESRNRDDVLNRLVKFLSIPLNPSSHVTQEQFTSHSTHSAPSPIPVTPTPSPTTTHTPQTSNFNPTPYIVQQLPIHSQSPLPQIIPLSDQMQAAQSMQAVHQSVINFQAIHTGQPTATQQNHIQTSMILPQALTESYWQKLDQILPYLPVLEKIIETYKEKVTKSQSEVLLAKNGQPFNESLYSLALNKYQDAIRAFSRFVKIKHHMTHGGNRSAEVIDNLQYQCLCYFENVLTWSRIRTPPSISGNTGGNTNSTATSAPIPITTATTSTVITSSQTPSATSSTMNHTMTTTSNITHANNNNNNNNTNNTTRTNNNSNKNNKNNKNQTNANNKREREEPVPQPAKRLKTENPALHLAFRKFTASYSKIILLRLEMELTANRRTIFSPLLSKTFVQRMEEAENEHVKTMNDAFSKLATASEINNNPVFISEAIFYEEFIADAQCKEIIRNLKVSITPKSAEDFYQEQYTKFKGWFQNATMISHAIKYCEEMGKSILDMDFATVYDQENIQVAKVNRRIEKMRAIADNDLIISGQKRTGTCTITKTKIVYPLRNVQCRHVFDSENIRELILKGKGVTKCPFAGCDNKIVIKDLYATNRLVKEIEDLNNQTPVVDKKPVCIDLEELDLDEELDQSPTEMVQPQPAITQIQQPPPDIKPIIQIIPQQTRQTQPKPNPLPQFKPAQYTPIAQHQAQQQKQIRVQTKQRPIQFNNRLVSPRSKPAPLQIQTQPASSTSKKPGPQQQNQPTTNGNKSNTAQQQPRPTNQTNPQTTNRANGGTVGTTQAPRIEQSPQPLSDDDLLQEIGMTLGLQLGGKTPADKFR